MLEEERKLSEERSKYKIYCKCGHSIVIYPFEKRKKKLCTHCGYYVYANKRVEFMDRLKTLIDKNFKVEGVFQ